MKMLLVHIDYINFYTEIVQQNSKLVAVKKVNLPTLCFQPVMMPGEVPHNLNVEEKRPRFQPQDGGRGGMGGPRAGRGNRPNFDRADR